MRAQVIDKDVIIDNEIDIYFLSVSLQDVDMMDQNGMTPLMWAAYRTHRCANVCVFVFSPL